MPWVWICSQFGAKKISSGTSKHVDFGCPQLYINTLFQNSPLPAHFVFLKQLNTHTELDQTSLLFECQSQLLKCTNSSCTWMCHCKGDTTITTLNWHTLMWMWMAHSWDWSSRFTYCSLTSYANYFHIKYHFTPIFSSVAFLFMFQVFIGDKGVTCGRGSALELRGCRRGLVLFDLFLRHIVLSCFVLLLQSSSHCTLGSPKSNDQL